MISDKVWGNVNEIDEENRKNGVYGKVIIKNKEDLEEFMRKEHEQADQLLNRMTFWLYISLAISIFLLVIGIFLNLEGK